MSEILSTKIRVGTAGWSYKDWHGIVYPEPSEKKVKELDYLANYFNVAEINSAFYRPANRFMSEAWVRKVAHNPDFLFTAKLWQRFTHDRKEPTARNLHHNQNEEKSSNFLKDYGNKARPPQVLLIPLQF